MPGKNLSESKRAQIMLLHNDGWSQRRISKSVRSSMYQDVQFSGVSKDQLIQVSLVNLGQGENLANPKQQVSILIEKLFKWLKDHQGPPAPR